MADRFPYDVFLSHNAQDKPRVRRLAERLKAAGVRVWFDEWDIQAGDIIALRRYKHVDFREESEAAFAGVSATQRETLLKLK